MKLYIDAQPLLGQKTGIGHYTNNLIKSFSKTNISIELVTNQPFNFKRLKNIQIVDGTTNLSNKKYPYKIIRRLMSPNVLYNFPIDSSVEKAYKHNSVFHATNFITLPTKYANQVVTIHDLAFMKFPEVVDANIYEYMMRWVPYSVNKANQIIADSQHTKRDILEFFNISEEKINVVYLAADKRFQKQTLNQVQNVCEKYSLPKEYLLYIGTLEPKKNLVTLIDVYYLLKKIFYQRKASHCRS